MKVLITQQDGDRYLVQNYKFKVLQSSLPDLLPVPQGVQRAVLKELGDSRSSEKKSDTTASAQEQGEPEAFFEDDTTISKEVHNEIVNSLLKKADEFSDKYLKAEMQYEDLLESKNEKEESIRKSAYEEGLQEGLNQAKAASENEQNALLEQMQEAIKTLSEESEKFSTALHGIKEELIGAALDIAKEVIVKELSENSHAITIMLAQKLIEDIDKESQIRLKINPIHVDTLTAAMSTNKNIKVEADSAVKVGGVIVISKLNTIEADIMGRYEQIKRSALNS